MWWTVIGVSSRASALCENADCFDPGQDKALVLAQEPLAVCRRCRTAPPLRKERSQSCSYWLRSSMLAPD
jgi:hypothetical protein